MEKRISQLEDFCLKSDRDDRCVLFEKQKTKLQKALDDFAKRNSSAFFGISLSRDDAYDENDAAMAGGSDSSADESLLLRRLERLSSRPQKRRPPRLSYTIRKDPDSQRSDTESEKRARKRVAPIYEWEVRPTSSSLSTPPTSSFSDSAVPSDDRQQISRVVAAFAGEYDLRVRLTAEEFEGLHAEAVGSSFFDGEIGERGATGRSPFLRKGSGHLAYSSLSNQSPTSLERDKLFLTSRGPYLDPLKIAPLKDEKYADGRPEFRLVGGRMTSDPESPKMPNYINAGLPYSSAHPSYYEKTLRSGREERSAPRFIAWTRGTKAASQTDRLLPIGAFSVLSSPRLTAAPP